MTYRQLRVYVESRRLRYSIDDPRPAASAAASYIGPVAAVQSAVLSEAEEDTSPSV
ncbi:hypothetical protein [Paraburkholderia ultramafica]|uniref:hypothetical protein n=1 Tax=Paraburkholderia ultramafica TaxID=1544867 RepID=UPI001583E397|nr:hypothetical protein [Paraburkholderia ultramafica]